MTALVLNRHVLADMEPADRARLLRRTEDNLEPYIEKMAPIIADIRKNGVDALCHYIQKIDQAPLTPDRLLASPEEFDQAFARLDQELIDVLTFAADTIRTFHQAQMPQMEFQMEIHPGVTVGERVTPIDAVALYSPRGKGAFPSVTLMTAVPSVVAGVPSPVILSPPDKGGRADDATLVAARLAGVEKVAKIGGGLAVTAAALGLGPIPRCAKFLGPGSPWVLAAKRLLVDEIDPGLPAGPSEAVLMADETADPAIAALDLLIEAEHGTDGSSYLVSWSESFLNQVQRVIGDYWSGLRPERAEAAHSVLSGPQGGLVLTPDPQTAYDFINDYAPEHLQILSKAPEKHLPFIRNAGEILLGEYTPGSAANYMMGPNCVLPTGQAARSHSALSVHDFLKRTSIGRMDKQGLGLLGPKTKIFAEYEGFDAHAQAVSDVRFKLLGIDQKQAG